MTVSPSSKNILVLRNMSESELKEVKKRLIEWFNAKEVEPPIYNFNFTVNTQTAEPGTVENFQLIQALVKSQWYKREKRLA